MRGLIFFLIPVVVILLALGHSHGAGLSPGHAVLHAATVILAAVLLYVATAAYARVRAGRFKWLVAAFAILLLRELTLSISMYTQIVLLVPGIDIPLDHLMGLLGLAVLAYALFKPVY